MSKITWLDVDLLVGRDTLLDITVSPEQLAGWVGPQVEGGVLGSLRALQFDVPSGNAEAARAASRLGLVPALSLDTRDWLGARKALDQAPDDTVVRLAPQRQDGQPSHPGFGAMVALCAERGFTILTEGDLRTWGPAYRGLGLDVVFLDAHFYHLGDLVALFGDEPGFHASTRLLNGPDSLSIVRDEVGLDRLVFGSRTGLHEGLSARERLRNAPLTPVELAAIAGGNLAGLLDPGDVPSAPAEPVRASLAVAEPAGSDAIGTTSRSDDSTVVSARSQRVIDAHAHWGPWFFSMETGSVGLNTDLLDRFGIDVQLVSAIEAITYRASSGNAALARVLGDSDESRLRGYVTVDPRDLDSARRDLRKLSGPKWVGVKIHTHYSATPIASDAMRAAIGLATDHGMPVLVHTWGSDLVDLAASAAAVGGSRVIAGHMGANAWPLVGRAREQYDEIWFEPCWSQPEAGRVRAVLDMVGHDRLVFGTDATLIDPSVTIGAIEAAGLSDDERVAVYGANAEALFHL